VIIFEEKDTDSLIGFLQKITRKWLLIIFSLGFLVIFILLKEKNLLLKFSNQLTSNYYRLILKPRESLQLDIKFKDVKKLEEKIKIASMKGILTDTEKDLVKAQVRYQEKDIPIKLRLKGNLLNNLTTDKWSLRIETDSNQAFNGMKRFSLQSPALRNYINEWLFLKILQDEELISLKYDFVDITINGENEGIYALEEHFSKEVIEHNQRREGPILKFNSDEFWKAVAEKKSLENNFYLESQIELFQQSQLETNPELEDLSKLAIKKLDAYRNGQLSPKNVFDYDSWSKYIALGDLFGIDQGLFWGNLRFYFNPITGKFEPIPFNNQPINTIKNLAIQNEELQPLLQLLNDDIFREKYFEKLKQYSQYNYIQNKLAKFQSEIDYYQKLLRRDYPGYSFSSTTFFDNANFIKRTLDNAKLNKTELPNLRKRPTEIVQGPEVINFISFNAELNRYVISSGKWILNKLITIPANSQLYISPDVILDLQNGGGIVSYSAINFDGKKNSPIKVISSNNTGSGILVIKAKKESHINYTNFVNLNRIKNQNHITTGGVTFYESKVKIDHSNLLNSQGEDALNIMRSDFLIINTEISNTKADGLDIDFGNGQIKNCSFADISNDAVDFSGSQVEMDEIKITNTGDKGISVGENSRVIVKNSEITNVRLGIASKDLSEVFIEEIYFNNIEFGLAAYQKKPEFGPAYIEEKSATYVDVKNPYIIEKESTLKNYLNKTIKGTAKNVSRKFQ